MNIVTPDGIKIFCLPNNAKCLYTDNSPEEMIDCPIHKFDAFGDVCIPELCENYTESERNRMTNIEKMVKASKEEMEQMLNSHDYCKNENNCVHKLGDDECIECIEKWLESEV